MAEFKLGRIRFVWKDEWNTGSLYYKDDVVTYSGRMYICVIGHTASADFFTDLDVLPPKWNLVADGQTWKGDWAPQVRYVYNDIVRYGARLYICQTIHTSADDSSTGLEPDLDKWQLYGEGLDWKGNWTTSFDYKANDFIKYGGLTYVCNTAHISAATTALGLEDDQSKWDIFNKGFDYLGDWTTGTRYKVNDVVRYGASLWLASQYHTASADFLTDTANWEKFVDGFQWEDRWLYTVEYQPGDIVRYGGNQYIATTNNNNSNPAAADSSDWKLFSEGFRFLGDWGEDSSSYEYEVGDLVRQGGYTYICKQDHQDQQPPNATYWEEFSKGLDWKSQWQDDVAYVLGDLVRYGDNTYICIQRHFSEGDDFSTDRLVNGGAQNSRPDQDTTGQYWAIFTVGSEESVLTTTGDLVYYSNNGPARLPIGQDGQILTVSAGGIPEWRFLGSSADVYYVAEHGSDTPAPVYGKTPDRPWKSIRYATQQIERGTKAPEACRLLELNRRFIQREIVEWTEYQVANADAGSIWENFEYDTKKCERDMGQLIDAFIYDLAHGGNEKSRDAAIKYVSEPGSFYSNDQDGQTVAAITYGLSLIETVLKGDDPAVNYQVTNGDNSTRVAEQIKITAYGRLDNVDYEGSISGGASGGPDSSPVFDDTGGINDNVGGGY